MAGIDLGTSRTNQFEGKRTTDWATMPVENFEVKFKLNSKSTKYVYIIRDGLLGSFLRKQAWNMYNDITEMFFFYFVTLVSSISLVI